MDSCGFLSASVGLAQTPPPEPTAEIPSVDWWITSRCNLACDFCYGPLPGRDPVNQREAILSALIECSARVVAFCGGEPLLVREVDQYALALGASGKRTVLNTNGSLLRRRITQGLELAFAVVGISIDGSTEATHRAMRGPKADLGEVLRAAELVAQHPGTSLKLATVVSEVNRDDLLALAALVRELRPDIWRLYQYSGRGVQNFGQERHRMSEDEFLRLVDAAAEQAAPVPTAPSTEALTAGCLIVDPEGNILQPVSTGYVRHGNCLNEPLDDIWTRIPARSTITANKRWLSVVAKR